VKIVAQNGFARYPDVLAVERHRNRGEHDDNRHQDHQLKQCKTAP